MGEMLSCCKINMDSALAQKPKGSERQSLPWQYLGPYRENHKACADHRMEIVPKGLPKVVLDTPQIPFCRSQRFPKGHSAIVCGHEDRPSTSNGQTTTLPQGGRSVLRV